MNLRLCANEIGRWMAYLYVLMMAFLLDLQDTDDMIVQPTYFLNFYK